ncbi:MAG: hypothetical protein ACQESR_29860 [Planctomycetota bacterium]
MTERDTASTTPPNGVDMSAAAIHQRLEEVEQLYELGTYLAEAKPVPPHRSRKNGHDRSQAKD